MKKNCYNCKFKGNIAGDAHISCNYPKLNQTQKINISSLLLITPEQGIQVLKDNFGFSVSTHPIVSGWFNFPINFDPNWIEGECTKHSEQPDVKRGIYFEECIIKFLKAYDKITLIKDESSENKDIHSQVLKTFEELKSNQNDIDILEKILKNTVNPLILKIENI